MLEYAQEGEHKAVSASERINLTVNIHRKLFAQLAEITVVAVIMTGYLNYIILAKTQKLFSEKRHHRAWDILNELLIFLQS